MNRLFCYWLLCACLLTSTHFLIAQNDSLSGTEWIDYFLDKEQIKKADSTLTSQINQYKNANLHDSLYQYPLYIGKVTLSKSNAENAALKAENFVNELKQYTTNARTLFKAYLSMDQLYLFLGDDTNCVAASKKALEYAKTLTDVTPKELGEINYVIGGNYYALYDLSNAVSYFKASATAYEQSEKAKKFKLADAYNGVAVSMWTLNKLDSAQVYFNKAIETTLISDLEGFDKTYYINAFKFNLALVIDDSGNVGEAIEIKKEIIKNLQDIIDNSKDDALVKKSERLIASAISNLGAFYNDTGYLTKAYDMMKYAYEKKKAVYESTSPRLATALGQIATSEIALKDFDSSINTLDKALKNLRESSSKYPAVEAELIYLQAKAYDEKKDTNTALKLFQQSETLYNTAYPSEYSREYLVFLRDYTMFLTKNKQEEKAIEIAKNTYNYILNNNEEDNFPLLKEIINLSEVYYESGDFKSSNEWAVKGRLFLEDKLKNATSQADTIQVEFRKPLIMLLESKSKYKLADKKDESLLLSITNTLDNAINILEKRKATIFSNEDISAVLAESKSITDFSKKINLELYNLTQNQQYLNNAIEQHESSIYSRIRNRLNMKNNMAFANISEDLLNREKQLKQQLRNTLDVKSSIQTFFEADSNWNQFLDSLKQRYPKYYKMRYATIDAQLNNIQSQVPDHTTVVRYLFIENNLYALVVTNNDKKLVPLSVENLHEKIRSLSEGHFEIEQISTVLFQLYNSLWKPFETDITSEKVIIIPDGDLFNLSFETLTPTAIKTFNELSTNSLLAKYSIAYNYSLLLLDKNRKPIEYDENFVAFAPEFNNKMKEKYSLSITDSINLDKTYLTLLPQPFSVNLVKDYSKLFKGTSFINEKASKQVFTKEANEHKIIHIGTHAESNNISPELSRLIFAKDNSDANNSLYTYEIYNQNLNSNLAILTACETGKPTYQSGEGMISLAHAFNYAGSESILTSLWKIDEQSSTKIIESFYNHLSEGLPKDKALQQAKLDYIATAEGRTVAPQYWAGLVLIGDTAPIDISTTQPFWLILLVAISTIGFFFVYFLKKKKTKQ